MNCCRASNLLHGSSCLCVAIETMDVVMSGGILQSRHTECLLINGAVLKGTDCACGEGGDKPGRQSAEGK